MGGRGASSATAVKKRDKPKQRGHLGPTEIPKTPEETAKYLGVSVQEAKDMYGAVQDFTGSSYTGMRQAQNSSNPDAYYLRKANLAERYIANAPKWGGGETFRGINVDAKTAATYVKGAILDINRGTASWSTDRSVSKSFSQKGYGQKVIFHSATQSRGTSIKHISHFKGESEVLVSKDARYRVTKTSKMGSYLHVYVEEV